MNYITYTLNITREWGPESQLIQLLYQNQNIQTFRSEASLWPYLSFTQSQEHIFFGRGMGLNTNSPLPYAMCMSGTKLVQVQLNNTMLEAWIKNNPRNWIKLYWTRRSRPAQVTDTHAHYQNQWMVFPIKAIKSCALVQL